MDLRLYGRVIWRFRAIVLVGLVLAFALTVFAVARISFKNGRPSISYRQQQLWQSTARIFVTQEGFPLVRSVYTKVIPAGKTNGKTNYIPGLASPDSFSSYATLFADLATSDDVRRFMLESGPVPGTVVANAGITPGLGTPRPLVELSGLATTSHAAIITARRGSQALIAYVKKQQDALGLPADQRVILKVLNQPKGAGIAVARSKTRPVVVFLAAVMAVLGLVFVLENLRPRLRSLEQEPPLRRPSETTRRSA